MTLDLNTLNKKSGVTGKENIIYTQELNILTGNQLLEMDVIPPKFIISEIMPTGLHMLAGSPKVGKSWLVLWLCDKIAKGESVWGYDTMQSEVLYLSLEDTFDRLHYRLSSMTEQSTDEMKLAVKSVSLEEGLIDQLENYLLKKPKTSLIVIDTFQLVRSGEDRISYANDYREISRLKEFADNQDIAILLVHHLRKTQDSDPINMISGSSGVSGAVDNIFILSKQKRIDNKAILSITGRDISDKAFELKFNRENNIWEFVKSVVEDENDTTQELLCMIKALVDLRGDFSGSATELIDSLKEINPDTIIQKNRITNILNRNIVTLEKSYGIDFSYRRTNKKRELLLKSICKCDSKYAC